MVSVVDVGGDEVSVVEVSVLDVSGDDVSV